MFRLYLVIIGLFVWGNSWASSPIDIKKLFADREFVPHVFLEKDVVKTFGSGRVIKSDGTVYRGYLNAADGMSLVFSGNEDLTPLYRVVEEVSVGKIGLRKNKFHVDYAISSIELFGVRVGAPMKDALREAKKKYGFKVEKVSYLGHQVDRISFYPSSEDTNTHYGYVCANGFVLNLIIGASG